ncbi:hypothetical protein ACFQL1_11840 [Halomicroarcula sp. GCM10025709]|uniref:hypothetical protein n=1 Tax=Halomicroarcula sp. GCM10025709 TaxID=3252669 RepID=UPI0036108BFC
MGALIGLAALVWFGLSWELNFFSSDQYAFANTLVAVLDGHLFIAEAVYGPPRARHRGPIWSTGASTDGTTLSSSSPPSGSSCTDSSRSSSTSACSWSVCGRSRSPA